MLRGVRRVRKGVFEVTITNISDPLERERLIETMREWATKESSLRLDDLAVHLGIKRYVFTAWLRTYPDLQDAYCPIKMLLARRRKILNRETRNFVVVPTRKRLGVC